MMRLQTKHICGLVALGFALLVIQYGFMKALLAAVITFAGWTVGRILDGEIDITRYIRRVQGDDLD